MHLAEIITLILGAVLFTVSFFMPDKGGKASLSEEEERKIIRELLDKEIDGAKFKIEEAAEDCVNDNKDRMERALDRITNEKMSAVDEYSNTVLDQIHKNHDEVMFLYDMLNNKHTQVKNTAAELNQITKSAKVATQEQAAVTAAGQKVAEQVAVAEQKVAEKIAVAEQKVAEKFAANDQQVVVPRKPTPEEISIFEELPAQKVELEMFDIKSDVGMNEVAGKNDSSVGINDVAGKNDSSVGINDVAGTKGAIGVNDTFAGIKDLTAEVVEEKPAPKKRASKPKVEKIPVVENIDLMFASDNNSANNNDRILELHKAGKSNMAIAKELGLGIGEVKLVIDLFEGI